MFCFVGETFLSKACVRLLTGYTVVRPFTEEEYAQLEVTIKYVGFDDLDVSSPSIYSLSSR